MLVIVVLSGGSTAVRSLFCVLFRNEMRGSDELPRPPPAGLLCSAAQVAPALVSGCVPSSALVGRPFQARSPARRPCCQVMLLSAAAPLRAKEQMVAPRAAWMPSDTSRLPVTMPRATSPSSSSWARHGSWGPPASPARVGRGWGVREVCSLCFWPVSSFAGSSCVHAGARRGTVLKPSVTGGSFLLFGLQKMAPVASHSVTLRS